MKIIKNGISFFMLVLVSSASFARSIEGDWYGKANVQGIEHDISAHVKAYGQVNSSYTEIKGNLVQGNLNVEIVFGRTSFAAPPGNQDSLKEIYDKQEVYVTMRDGKRLFTSIYTPRNESVTHPILLLRTPYNIEPSGPDKFNHFMLDYSRYIEEEYIMVYQDVRGRYMSEGEFEDIRPVIPEKKSSSDTDETTDTWDTVEWLIKNVKNNNGNVGIFGISYPGFYSTMGIINAHPAVKAVSPQAPVTAWFIGDDFHHNGAFFPLDCFPFYYSFGQPRKIPTRQGNPRFNWPVPDNYEFFLSLGAIKNIAPKYFGDSIKFWIDAFAHPDYDNFWKARDPRQYLKNVTPAVMTVGGWFDAEDLYGALHIYRAIETQNSPETDNYILMGPWAHSQWAFGEAYNLGNIYWGLDANEKFIELERNFFNHYLKKTDNFDLPEATIFITGSNEWRDFDTWPPKNIVEKKLFFHAGETASFNAPSVSKSFDEYISDPMNPVPYTEDVHASRTAEYMTDDQRFASRRPDVMVYQTDILTEDITFTGPLTADLFVSTTGTDADYIVKLIDVFPPDIKACDEEEIKVPLGGYQMLVRGEVFRGKYRNSFEKPEPFEPGKITEIKYEIPDIAHIFKKGHRIMIQVQNSWFPLVDRNPQKFVNIYECSDSDFQKAIHRIYHDAKYPSHIKVNVLK